MTFLDDMKQRLVGQGMFESQAQQVMGRAMEQMDDMKGRWGHQVDGYPPLMVDLIWISIQRVAYVWIEDNMPEAWYRPIFAMACGEEVST